jgi:hypothetical protein
MVTGFVELFERRREGGREVRLWEDGRGGV